MVHSCWQIMLSEEYVCKGGVYLHMLVLQVYVVFICGILSALEDVSTSSRNGVSLGWDKTLIQLWPKSSVVVSICLQPAYMVHMVLVMVMARVDAEWVYERPSGFDWFIVCPWLWLQMGVVYCVVICTSSLCIVGKPLKTIVRTGVGGCWTCEFYWTLLIWLRVMWFKC